jgi:3-oxoacyl-[acyl-carrier-protein] synthase II
MLPPIAIHAVAAKTPLGNLEEVWKAWVAGGGPDRMAGPQADCWTERTGLVMHEMLAALQDWRAAGLILATTKGDIGTQVECMREGAEPPTLGGAAAMLGSSLGGPVYTVSTACSSGLIALIDAAVALVDGEAKQMIALAADESTSFVHDGFRALKALSTTSCKPFDKRRDGLMLGAAAAGMVLALGDSRVRISGFGVSNDATHMTAPDAAAGGLVRAIEQALRMANLEPQQIDVLFAHGTGTKYNDAMEAVAIEQVFLRGGGKGPAVTAVKSLIGHTLGAAGLIEAALTVRMLQEQVVPGIINLAEPEVAAIDLVRETRRCPVRHVMKTASGFGGMNAAVILSAGGA